MCHFVVQLVNICFFVRLTVSFIFMLSVVVVIFFNFFCSFNGNVCNGNFHFSSESVCFFYYIELSLFELFLNLKTEDCSILLTLFLVSGEVPEHPVLSPVSKHIFERRLIEKFIAENGTDPITGDALNEVELIELKSKFHMFFIILFFLFCKFS